MYDSQENACVSSPERSNGDGLQVGRHQLKVQAKSALRVPHLPCPAQGFVFFNYYLCCFCFLIIIIIIMNKLRSQGEVV